jgi:hypothetical protein
LKRLARDLASGKRAEILTQIKWRK